MQIKQDTLCHWHNIFFLRFLFQVLSVHLFPRSWFNIEVRAAEDKASVLHFFFLSRIVRSVLQRSKSFNFRLFNYFDVCKIFRHWSIINLILLATWWYLLPFVDWNDVKQHGCAGELKKLMPIFHRVEAQARSLVTYMATGDYYPLTFKMQQRWPLWYYAMTRFVNSST